MVYRVGRPSLTGCCVFIIAWKVKGAELGHDSTANFMES